MSVDEQPLRVALYTSSASGYGGAEVVLRDIARHAGDDVRVTVVGIDDVTVGWIARSSGRPGHVVRSRRSALPFRTLDHARLFRRERFDLVHLNMTGSLTGTAAGLGLILSGTPYLLVEHLPTRLPKRAHRLVKRSLVWRARAHVAVGARSAAQTEEREGLPTGSMVVIPNGVQVPPMECAAERSRVFIGVAARLEHAKGLDVLVAALARLPGGVTARIAGDGSQRLPLQEQAERLGVVDRVEFTGWLEDPIARLNSEVFVLSSRSEAMPLTVLEAMRAGMAVVATDVGSVRDVVEHQRTGLVVPPDDVDALVAALRRLLDDDGLRADIARRAKALADEQFTVERMASAYSALYRRAARR